MPEKQKKQKKKTIRSRAISPTRIIAITFAAIILVGTLLLMLPVASRSGQSNGFRTALFTATSATCVTGLVLGDTWSLWSGFGQTVIITMIEIGGLGFMSAAAIVLFLFRRKVGLRQRMIMAQALSLNEMEGVVRLQKWVLLGSLTVQGIGAAILFARFLPDFGFRTALKWGVFHAISAFCNAGFDIFGAIEPGKGLILFNDDPVVCLTLMALVIISGLGFFVWEEVVRIRSFKKLSVYTKLVLLTTGALLLLGTVGISLLEWDNPETIGNMPLWQKMLNSAFQSVTLRTAGFASIDQGALTDGGKVISILLMFVGGSSGSTAGGIKTVTVIVLFLFIWTRLRGRKSVNVFKHRIADEKIFDAMAIVFIVTGLAAAGALVVCTTSGISFLNALYETASAIATVGLSAAGTANLNAVSQYLLILFMYFGRVGVLTISLGFLLGNRAEDRFRYADTNILIG